MVSLPECYTPRKLRLTHPQGANTSGDRAEDGSRPAASLRRPPPRRRRCRGRPRNGSRRSGPCHRIPDTSSAPRASPRRGPRRRASGCPLGPSSPSTRRSVLYAPGPLTLAVAASGGCEVARPLHASASAWVAASHPPPCRGPRSVRPRRTPRAEPPRARSISGRWPAPARRLRRPEWRRARRRRPARRPTQRPAPVSVGPRRQGTAQGRAAWR
jgi:hypothetical protein